jgi:hypothetical protein
MCLNGQPHFFPHVSRQRPNGSQIHRDKLPTWASKLQGRKLIRYTRDKLTILNADGLQAAACTCYAADKETYARILS